MNHYFKFLFFIILYNTSILCECLSGDCINGLGLKVYPGGDRYDGSWFNGKAHGIGTLYYKNGNKYIGNWDHGRASGEGTMYYMNGNTYVGQWKESRAHGMGIMYGKDGKVIYQGNWKEGMMVDKPSQSTSNLQ